MKNRLFYTFLLTLLVTVGLAALQFLPSLSLWGYEMRPVRLLADVCREPEEEIPADTLVLPKVKPEFREECPPSVTLIEDYSREPGDSACFVGRGMSRFYEAVEGRTTLGRPVRIAYFGDSFIEGDIMTADLRSLLQSAFGGSGVGFVDIASPTAGFRSSVRAYSKGWSSHCITDTVWFDRQRQGLAERYYVPRGWASVQLQGIPGQASLHRDTCTLSGIYFRSPYGVSLTARVNGQEAVSFYPAGREEVQYCEVRGRIGRVQWQVNDSTSTTFYGVTMENESGMVLDNFSLRGSSGMTLRTIPDHTLQEFARIRCYDLIVLQFGLNVANRRMTDYSSYQREMERVVKKLADGFPEASILIVGVGDRGERRDGEVKTMRGIRNLVKYQQQIAYRTGCCFWNLYEAMGGEGSMARMVEVRPSQANMDYTHINFRGGKKVAQLLYDALMAGKKNYEKRKAYEAGE